MESSPTTQIQGSRSFLDSRMFVIDILYLTPIHILNSCC